MNQRSVPRLEATGPVRVTVLEESKRELGGVAVSFSPNGINLFLEEPVAPGAPLMVEWDDSEALGEVCQCQPEADGYAVFLKIEHALLGTRELARLASRLLGEAEHEHERTHPPS